MLNADFRPLSYFPLSLWSWQESVKAVFLDRVNIVSPNRRDGVSADCTLIRDLGELYQGAQMMTLRKNSFNIIS